MNNISNFLFEISQKFSPSEIVIIKDYPRLVQGHLMIRFKVFYPGSNELFPNQAIYNMAKEQKNIAGYPIVLQHSNVSPTPPQTGKRSAGLSHKMKIVVITLVVVLFIAAILTFVFIYTR